MALWNPSRDFGSEHSFAIDKVPPGLSLERNTFKLFWVDYYEKAITLIRRSFKDFKPEKLPANVIGLLKKTSDQMREFELSINILGKKAQRLKRAEYYNSLVGNETLRIAVLAYYFHILDKESVVSNWDEKSDLEIQQWLTDPRKFLNKKDHPKAFFQLISYHLFQKKDLVEKEVLIGIPNLMEKEVLQQGEYRFIPSPRGIHSVFKGVCHKECIGGNEDSITSLTPERWASAILDGVKFYFVEHNQKNLGWFQLLPIENNNTGEIFYNFESGSTFFNRDMIVPGSRIARESAFDKWFRVYRQVNPGASNLVLGQSNYIRNAGSLIALRDSLSHRLGSWVGSHTNFVHVNQDLVNYIVSKSPKTASEGEDFIERHNPGNMIIDATANGVGGFQLFESVAPEVLRSGNALYSYFESADREKQVRIISQFMQFDFADVAMESLIYSWYFETSSEEKEKIREYLAYDTRYGLLRPARILLGTELSDISKFMDLIKKTNGNRIGFISKSIARFHTRGLFLDLPDSFYEHQLSESVNMNFNDKVELQKLMIEKTKSAEEFVKVFKKRDPTPNSDYVDDLADLMIQNLHRFFSFNPSVSEIRKLGKKSNLIRVSVAIHQESLKHANSAAEYLHLLRPFVLFPNKKYLQRISKIAESNVEEFLKLNPNYKEVYMFGKQVTNVDVALRLHQWGIERAKTPGEIISFLKLHTDNPSQNYKKEMNKLLTEKIHYFLSFNPTVQQRIEYLSRNTDVSSIEKILVAMIPYVESKSVWRRIVRTHVSFPSEAYVKSINKLRSEYKSVYEALPEKAGFKSRSLHRLKAFGKLLKTKSGLCSRSLK